MWHVIMDVVEGSQHVAFQYVGKGWAWLGIATMGMALNRALNGSLSFIPFRLPFSFIFSRVSMAASPLLVSRAWCFECKEE